MKKVEEIRGLVRAWVAAVNTTLAQEQSPLRIQLHESGTSDGETRFVPHLSGATEEEFESMHSFNRAYNRILIPADNNDSGAEVRCICAPFGYRALVGISARYFSTHAALETDSPKRFLSELAERVSAVSRISVQGGNPKPAAKMYRP
ncbi:MAG: hypothetical protein GC136_01780 [Alphaproteobacteria bacterium]|nr:hypothetical protein [Alphaproteobacteria bacterium]